MAYVFQDYSFVVYTNPCLTTGGDTRLGVLTHADNLTFEPAYNSAGGGTFDINAHSDQAAWCEPLNYVRVFLDGVEDEAHCKHGFFLEQVTETGVADGPEGEFLQCAGRGALAVYARAVLQDRPYNTPSPPFGMHEGEARRNEKQDGFWSWRDRPPLAVWTRQWEECTNRPWGNPIGPTTITFDRDVDTDGNPWAVTANDIKLPILANLHDDVLPVMQELGAVVYMHPWDFVTDGWDTPQGTDLSGSITLDDQVIVGTAERPREAFAAYSTVLVQGDLEDGLYTYAIVNDPAIVTAIGPREAGIAMHYTPTPEHLETTGRSVLDSGLRRYAGPDALTVQDSSGQVALVDYLPGDTLHVQIDPLAEGDKVVQSVVMTQQDAGWFQPTVKFQAGTPYQSTGDRDAVAEGNDPFFVDAGMEGSTKRMRFRDYGFDGDDDDYEEISAARGTDDTDANITIRAKKDVNPTEVDLFAFDNDTGGYAEVNVDGTTGFVGLTASGEMSFQIDIPSGDFSKFLFVGGWGIVFPSLAADPAGSESEYGQVYWSTSTNSLRIYDGAAWSDLGSGGGGGGSDDQTAAEVPITDAGGYFTGTDVEAALQELGATGGVAAQFDLDTPNNTLRFKTGYNLISAETGDASTEDAYFSARAGGGFFRAEFGSYGGSGSSFIESREGQLGMTADLIQMNVNAGGKVYVIGGEGVIFPTLSADPGGGDAGQVYFNDSTGKFRGYDGAAWADLN